MNLFMLFIYMNNNKTLAAQLKSFTQSFIPHLHFSEPLSDYLLSNNEQNKNTDKLIVIELYEAIKKSTPEADHSYWISRTWTLLCWQPLYIAFISIYGLKHLPNFEHFKQRQHQGAIQGINFLYGDFIKGETDYLINTTATSLNASFEYFRQMMDEAYRCRPRFTQALLSDTLLIAIMDLKQYSPEYLPPEYIIQQAETWLSAFSLPPLKKGLLIIDPRSKELKHKRESCCFIYKTDNGKLCGNCPRKKS